MRTRKEIEEQIEAYKQSEFYMEKASVIAILEWVLQSSPRKPKKSGKGGRQ